MSKFSLKEFINSYNINNEINTSEFIITILNHFHVQQKNKEPIYIKNMFFNDKYTTLSLTLNIGYTIYLIDFKDKNEVLKEIIKFISKSVKLIFGETIDKKVRIILNSYNLNIYLEHNYWADMTIINTDFKYLLHNNNITTINTDFKYLLHDILSDKKNKNLKSIK